MIVVMKPDQIIKETLRLHSDEIDLGNRNFNARDNQPWLP